MNDAWMAEQWLLLYKYGYLYGIQIYKECSKTIVNPREHSSINVKRL